LAYRSLSLERGLAILSCFSGERPVLGIADIADELGMGRSTTHRYVITLVALGYMQQEKDGRKYRLGLRCTDLGMLVLDRGGLGELAWRYLAELRDTASASASLAVLDGDEIVLLACARSYRRGQCKVDPEFRMRKGSRLPAYCTSLGKVLLAATLTPDIERKAIDRIELKKRAPGTITSKRQLGKELRGVRDSDMLAVCDQELAGGLQTIAVPLLREGEVVAALGLATYGLGATREELIDRLAPTLRRIAQRVSGLSGWSDPARPSEPERKR
jgi:IclR family pca regulon transcriptional regulator